MAIEEAVEQKAQDAAVKAVEAGGQLTLRASKALALMLVKNGWKLITGTAGRISGTVKHHMDTGKVSERKLQSLGQDVHMIELPEDSLKAVSKSLREAGITYHVEQTGEGGYYLHFQGKDKDHVEHAVKRAFERIGLTFDAEEITPQQRTGQQQNPSDPKADEARKSAAPLMPTQSEADSSPDFTMRFETMEWDPDAEIIGNNLAEMGIPYTQSPDGEFRQSFTFKQAYAPAVKRFLDKYSDHPQRNIGLHLDGVANYGELERAVADQQTQRSDRREQQPENEQPPARAEEPQPVEAPKPEPRQSKPATERQRTEDGRKTSRPAGRASRRGKKTRADFLAELKQRTAEKVTESRQAPKRTRKQSRSKHNTR